MKKIIHILLLLLINSIVLSAYGIDLKTYYAKAKGKKGSELKTAMCEIIYKSSAAVSYEGLKTAYLTTDVRSDGYMNDMYSNTTNYRPGTDFKGTYTSEGDGYNREHTIPQSVFNKAAPMVSDLFHVYPTDAKINGVRSNYCHGEVGTVQKASNNNYSLLGSPTDELKKSGCNVSPVFEPADEWKGDIARTYFYFVTCYQSKMTSLGSYGMFSNDTYPSLTTWAKTMLLKWSKNDQVSTWEVNRNENVYNYPSKGANNRNPFIDFPGLEEYIWGSYTNVEFDPENYVNPYTGEGGNTGGDGGETGGDGGDGGNTGGEGGETGGDTPSVTPVTGEYAYVLVTEAPTDWTGEYLIVYNKEKAFNGALTTLDATNNYIEVKDVDGWIESSSTVDAATFAIEPIESGGYSVKSKSGKYIGNTTSETKNGLSASDKEKYVNSFTFSGTELTITSNGHYLCFNTITDQSRFRYYTTTSEKIVPVSLYRKVELPITIGVIVSNIDKMIKGNTSITIDTITTKANKLLQITE